MHAVPWRLLLRGHGWLSVFGLCGWPLLGFELKLLPQLRGGDLLLRRRRVLLAVCKWHVLASCREQLLFGMRSGQLRGDERLELMYAVRRGALLRHGAGHVLCFVPQLRRGHLPTNARFDLVRVLCDRHLPAEHRRVG